MRSKPIQTVIFDIDGTLVDSVQLHAQAWHEAFAHYDREVSLDAVGRQIGKGADQLLPIFLYPHELAKFGDALSQYRGKLFRTKYLPHVRPLPGVRDLFLRLRFDQKTIALASSADPKELGSYLEIANVADLVDAVTTAGDAERSKPHADIIEAVLARIPWSDPAETVMIGDSPFDAMAARKLRIATFGVETGPASAAELKQAGCVRVYRDVRELGEVYPFRASAAVARGSVAG